MQVLVSTPTTVPPSSLVSMRDLSTFPHLSFNSVHAVLVPEFACLFVCLFVCLLACLLACLFASLRLLLDCFGLVCLLASFFACFAF